MNFIEFIFVFERKDKDCIMMEKPLKEIIADINDRDRGEYELDNNFIPFVISTMPDITPWKIVVLSWFKPIIDCKNKKTLRFVKRSIIRVKRAI